MFLKFMVFWGVRARVRGAISPILRYSKLFAAILGPECLVDFLFKGFLIIGCVPVVLKAEPWTFWQKMVTLNIQYITQWKPHLSYRNLRAIFHGSKIDPWKMDPPLFVWRYLAPIALVFFDGISLILSSRECEYDAHEWTLCNFDSQHVQ